MENKIEMRNYKFITKLVVVLLSYSAIVSCGKRTVHDASSDPEFVEIVGKTFRLKEEVWAIGITTDKNYKKRLDYITLEPGVGFSGPEVVSKERCCKGNIFKIVRVFATDFLIFSNIYVEYVVEEVGSNKFKNIELKVDVLEPISNSNYGLDKAVYERV